MGTTTGRATARAALAGNPSDGFGGAVLAVPVPGLEATVEVGDGDGVVVGGRRWPGLADVIGPHQGEGALLSATVERLVAWCRADGPGVPDDGIGLTWATTIPRSVGLAGSSALVVAALRALSGRWDLELDVATTARLALEVETDLLGIAAGPQDRLVQAAGRTLLMDFAGPTWEVVPVDPPAPVALFVAWTPAASAPSQVVHGPLTGRAAEPAVRRAMGRLAELAHHAAEALRAGDVAALGAAMDGTYEQRAAILDLAPAHVALVHGARDAGAAVNYTGSGGAVVGLGGDLDAIRTWAERDRLGLLGFGVPARAGRAR